MKVIIYLTAANQASSVMNRLGTIGATNIQQLTYMDRFIIANVDSLILPQIKAWSEVLQLETDANAFQAQGIQSLSVDDNWGLDRIDQEQLPLNRIYRYSRTAGNVDVYVIDSGVNLNHSDFISTSVVPRGSRLYDYRVDLDMGTPSRILPNSASYALDDNGHGSLVASVIAGERYGVAKHAGIKSVKVFSENLDAYTSWILRGLNAVLGDHIAKGSPSSQSFRPSIANMSFSASMRNESPILAIAVQTLINSGIICVSAAGNDSEEIGKFLASGDELKAKVVPGSLGEVITVGAWDRNDTLLTMSSETVGSSIAGTRGSNWGTGVDIYAPGENIRGAWKASLGNASSTSGMLSGTSPATGFVSGVVALYLEDYNQLYVDNPSSVGQSSVKQFLQGTASHGGLLRNVFVPSNMQWITPTGLLQTFYEGQPLRFQLRATNAGNAEIDYTFAFDSQRHTLSLAGFGLTGDGLLYGTANPVDSSSPGYVFVDSLPEEQRNVFPLDVKGYLDLTFDVLAQDKTAMISRYNYTVQSRSFTLRILDKNLGPKWIPPERTIRLDQLPAFAPDYFTVGNEVLIDFNDGLIGHSIDDPDGDTIDWNTQDGVPKLLIGSLPPGLTLNNDGTITGTLEPFPSLDGETRLYQFMVRAYDGRLYADKFFQVLVKRIATGNTQPYWNNTNSKGYTSGALSSLTLGQAVLIRLEAFDVEGDQIDFTHEPIVSPDVSALRRPTFASAPIGSLYISFPTEGLAPHINDPTNPSHNPNEPPRYHGLPKGVYIDLDGTLRGVVAPDNKLGEYYFQINISDGFANGANSRVFRIDILDNSTVGWFEPISNIVWVTEEGLLGELEETSASHLQVQATSELNLPIVYEMSDTSQLPPGLSLDGTTGEIQGRAGYVGVDTEYTFKIKAYLQKFINMFAVREFTIRIKNKFTHPISVVKCSIMGPEQTEILSFIRSSKMFEPQNNNLVYKPYNSNFGIRNELSMFILGGLPVLQPSQFWEKIRDDLPITDPADFTLANVTPVSNFHRPTSFIFGDIKLAKARNSLGEVLYEMLYVEVYDAAARAGGFKDGEPDPIEYAHPDLNDPTSPELIFPTAVTNWRNDLKQDPNGVTVERLPLWMTSEQIAGDETSVIGFVPCIELMCLNSGYSAQALMATLNITGVNSLIRNRKFTVDRYVVEDWTNPNNIRKRYFKFPPGDLH